MQALAEWSTHEEGSYTYVVYTDKDLNSVSFKYYTKNDFNDLFSNDLILETQISRFKKQITISSILVEFRKNDVCVDIESQIVFPSDDEKSVTYTSFSTKGEIDLYFKVVNFIKYEGDVCFRTLRTDGSEFRLTVPHNPRLTCKGIKLF